MTSKIVSLRGAAIAPGEPSAEIIAGLERLLADARAGAVKAVAVVYVAGNGRAQYLTLLPEHATGIEFGMLHSGIACLHHHITASFVESAHITDLCDGTGDDDAPAA